MISFFHHQVFLVSPMLKESFKLQMFFLYFHECHYGDFDGLTRMVTIGCEFYLVDLNFIGAFCDVSIEFPIVVFCI
jgi:hypothetical protein